MRNVFLALTILTSLLAVGLFVKTVNLKGEDGED